MITPREQAFAISQPPYLVSYQLANHWSIYNPQLQPTTVHMCPHCGGMVEGMHVCHCEARATC